MPSPDCFASITRRLEDLPSDGGAALDTLAGGLLRTFIRLNEQEAAIGRLTRRVAELERTANPPEPAPTSPSTVGNGVEQTKPNRRRGEFDPGTTARGSLLSNIEGGGMKRGSCRSTRTHPKSLVSFIVEAIDEVAPGQGERVYWLAFERFQADVANRQQKEAARELRQAMRGQAPAPEEEWTVEC